MKEDQQKVRTDKIVALEFYNEFNIVCRVVIRALLKWADWVWCKQCFKQLLKLSQVIS